MASIRDSVVSTYRKLTHKNPSYNREDAFEEKQKINDWLDYGSLRGLANMTEKEMVDGRLEILRKEQKILNNLLLETHSIQTYRDRFERPIFGLWFQVKHNSENEKEAIQSVRKQTEAELERFGSTYCEGHQHPKLEEIDIVARALDKRNEIDKKFYAILARLEDRIVDLRGMAEKGNANIDSELAIIQKDFDKNIKLFEYGTLDDSDEELVSHYICVH
jgi:hypothetical protein